MALFVAVIVGAGWVVAIAQIDLPEHAVVAEACDCEDDCTEPCDCCPGSVAPIPVVAMQIVGIEVAPPSGHRVAPRTDVDAAFDAGVVDEIGHVPRA